MEIVKTHMAPVPSHSILSPFGKGGNGKSGNGIEPCLRAGMDYEFMCDKLICNKARRMWIFPFGASYMSLLIFQGFCAFNRENLTRLLQARGGNGLDPAGRAGIGNYQSYS